MTRRARNLQRWDDLRLFLRVAETSSLSAAARDTGLEQSTLSRRLDELERSLGAQLLERTSRGTRLTPLGEDVRELAREMDLSVARIFDAVEAADSELEGRIRIALTEGLAIHFVIPKVLPKLREAFPKLEVELVTGITPADLTRNEADLAIRFFRNTEGALTVKRLGQLQRTYLVARSRARSFKNKQVRELPWIGNSLDALDGVWLKEIGVTELVLRTPSYEAQLAAIRTGLGVGLAASAFRALYPDLATLGASLPKPPPLEVFLATRTSIRRTPKIRVLYELLEEEFAQLFRLGDSP